MEQCPILLNALCCYSGDRDKKLQASPGEDKPAATETNLLAATATRPWSAFKDWYWI